jgi:multimeric flavodoxin WrbA
MERKINVVGIISSPKHDGNTAALVREALKGAEERGAHVSEIFLAEHGLGFCTGCLQCSARGNCLLPDDFESLRKAVYEADGLIIGSPTYGATFNAILKNFYERLGMYTLLTSSLGGKYVAGISTANGNAAKKTAKEIVRIFMLGIFKRTYITGAFGAATAVKGNRLDLRQNAAAMAGARALGAKVAEDIKTQRTYPMQNLLARFLVRQKIRPLMRGYIIRNRDGRERATYENLKIRGLI